MKLGDRIKLHWEKKGMFSDSEPEIVDGEFIVIGVSLSWCKAKIYQRRKWYRKSRV